MVDLHLLWHMHQPRYVDPLTGVPILPWVRVHACSGYLDMARALERFPEVRATVNFVPSLVEQLEALVGGQRDALELLTERPASSLEAYERTQVQARCFSVHHREIDARPRFAQLSARRHQAFDPAELRDVACLFLLGWAGFSARREEPVFGELDAKGRDFSEGDKAELHAAVRRVAAKVLPAWRALGEKGQVELCTSPYHHPILPLLLDTDVAHRSRPEDWLPPRFSYPEDAELHLKRAIALHTRWTGRAPKGMWPPEGSLSPEAVALYAEAGVRWLGADVGTLQRSLNHGGTHGGTHAQGPGSAGSGGSPRAHTRHYLHHRVSLFFRDRELSDRIGFQYAHLPAPQAVDDLVGGVLALGARSGQVNVFLDGENAWEHYAGRGEPFLETLYGRLAAESKAGTLRTSTPSETLERRGPGSPLPRLHSGSWIASTFQIWIGDEVKNRAWAALRAAREHLRSREAELGSDDARVLAARERLLAAEASDWMWWFGEPNNSSEDALYDELFRRYLVAAYHDLDDDAPTSLAFPIDPGRSARERGKGEDAGRVSTMRKGEG